MAESHSEIKGKERPLIRSVERYSEGDGYRACITIDIPATYDFEHQGKRLLAGIKSAANLFCEEAES